MLAMVLHESGKPLRLERRPDPIVAAGEVRLKVEACAVCRTDLHVVDGDLMLPRLPIVPGHEIVGTVELLGEGVKGVAIGDRLGIPWLGGTCGHCRYCLGHKENLCDTPVFTGHGRDGGFATHVVANAAFCIPLDRDADPVKLAPLLCAGLIGWRTLRAAGDDIRELGIYGFGAAAHLVAQVARHEGRRVHAFTRPGDVDAQSLARRVGATWAGGTDEPAPVELDAALIFAPVGDLVPLALQAVRKGGRVVCGGIHMSDIPTFPYKLLWGERQVSSVANLTRADAVAFFAALEHMNLLVETTVFPLPCANDALAQLKSGHVQGAAVLVPHEMPASG